MATVSDYERSKQSKRAGEMGRDTPLQAAPWNLLGRNSLYESAWLGTASAMAGPVQFVWHRSENRVFMALANPGNHVQEFKRKQKSRRPFK